MTGSTLLLFLLVGRRTGLRDRMLVQASTGVPELGSVTTLVKRIAVFTLVVELAGAIVLTVAFLADGSPLGKAVWWGVFHAISAFNNAGFDLIGGFRSLTDYADDPFVLGPIGLLLVVGGLGYAIVGDVVGQAPLESFRARDEDRAAHVDRAGHRRGGRDRGLRVVESPDAGRAAGGPAAAQRPVRDR